MGFLNLSEYYMMYMALVKANLQEDILCGSQAGGFLSGTLGRTGIHVRIPVSLEISPRQLFQSDRALKLSQSHILLGPQMPQKLNN